VFIPGSEKAIKPYIDRWKSIDIRAVCFIAYNKWINLGTRIVLSEKATKDIKNIDFLPEFPRFMAFHEVLDISNFHEILEQLNNGVLNVR